MGEGSLPERGHRGDQCGYKSDIDELSVVNQVIQLVKPDMICILGPAIDGIYAACMVVHLSHLTLDTWVPWRINKLEALIVKSLYLKMVMSNDFVSVARHSQVSCSRAHDLNSPSQTDTKQTSHGRPDTTAKSYQPKKKKENEKRRSTKAGRV
jgi:hypothetical protein